MKAGVPNVGQGEMLGDEAREVGRAGHLGSCKLSKKLALPLGESFECRQDGL